MANIIKGLKKLNSREHFGAVSAWIDDPILGVGLDAQLLPDGHLACPNDGKPYFFVNLKRCEHSFVLECFCAHCGDLKRIILPVSAGVTDDDCGRFQCQRHPNAAAAVIVNAHTVCVGCGYCATEMRFDCEPKGVLWTPTPPEQAN